MQVSEEKIRNSHIVIADNGEIQAVYRKMHLFDVDIPEKNVRLKESDYVEAGTEIVAPVKSPVGKIGLEIVSFLPCSDGRDNFRIVRYPVRRVSASIVASFFVL